MIQKPIETLKSVVSSKIVFFWKKYVHYQMRVLNHKPVYSLRVRNIAQNSLDNWNINHFLFTWVTFIISLWTNEQYPISSEKEDKLITIILFKWIKHCQIYRFTDQFNQILNIQSDRINGDPFLKATIAKKWLNCAKNKLIQNKSNHIILIVRLNNTTTIYMFLTSVADTQEITNQSDGKIIWVRAILWSN